MLSGSPSRSGLSVGCLRRTGVLSLGPARIQTYTRGPELSVSGIQSRKLRTVRRLDSANAAGCQLHSRGECVCRTANRRGAAVRGRPRVDSRAIGARRNSRVADTRPRCVVCCRGAGRWRDNTVAGAGVPAQLGVLSGASLSGARGCARPGWRVARWGDRRRCGAGLVRARNRVFVLGPGARHLRRYSRSVAVRAGVRGSTGGALFRVDRRHAAVSLSVGARAGDRGARGGRGRAGAHLRVRRAADAGERPGGPGVRDHLEPGPAHTATSRHGFLDGPAGTDVRCRDRRRTDPDHNPLGPPRHPRGYRRRSPHP